MNNRQTKRQECKERRRERIAAERVFGGKRARDFDIPPLITDTRVSGRKLTRLFKRFGKRCSRIDFEVAAEGSKTVHGMIKKLRAFSWGLPPQKMVVTMTIGDKTFEAAPGATIKVGGPSYAELEAREIERQKEKNND